MGKKWSREQHKKYKDTMRRKRVDRLAGRGPKSHHRPEMLWGSQESTASLVPSDNVQEGELVGVLKTAHGPSIVARLTDITRMLVNAQLKLVDLRDIISSNDE